MLLIIIDLEALQRSGRHPKCFIVVGLYGVSGSLYGVSGSLWPGYVAPVFVEHALRPPVGFLPRLLPAAGAGARCQTMRQTVPGCAPLQWRRQRPQSGAPPQVAPRQLAGRLRHQRALFERGCAADGLRPRLAPGPAAFAAAPANQRPTLRFYDLFLLG